MQVLEAPHTALVHRHTVGFMRVPSVFAQTAGGAVQIPAVQMFKGPHMTFEHRHQLVFMIEPVVLAQI